MEYRHVIIPENKDPKEFSYKERRHELLKAIIEAGHPDFVSRTQAAKRYGVTHSQISQDITAIRKGINEEYKTDADLIIASVFQKSMKELMKKGKHKEAAQVASDWGKWLFDRKVIEKAPDQIDVNISNAEKKLEDAYKRLEGKNWRKAYR